MATIWHHLDIYKVPRASVDVEAIARGLARYLQMTAEDTEVLSQDPTRRDKLIAEMYKQPGIKPNCYASQRASVPADAEIAKLTPPKTFEDRVNRLHLAFAAMMVYNQYKVAYALPGSPDLEHKVQVRRREIMDEWRRNVFHVRFPPRRRGFGMSSTVTTPTSTPLQVPTPSQASSHCPEQVSEDKLLNFLSSPHTMIGKQFVHSPPQGPGQDQEDTGMWEVISYSVKKADNGVVHEYQVLFQAFGADPVPMGTEEVRYLLQYSALVV